MSAHYFPKKILVTHQLLTNKRPDSASCPEQAVVRLGAALQMTSLPAVCSRRCTESCSEERVGGRHTPSAEAVQASPPAPRAAGPGRGWDVIY